MGVRRPALTVLVAALPLLTGAFAPAGSGTPCENLSALAIPNVTITSSAALAAGPFTPPGAPASARAIALPAFCRVVGVAAPTADSAINFEVWIPPAGAWNAKFQGVGNGGFAGSISYGDMATALRAGYATAGTDTGHTGDDLRFAEGHPERIGDWAYRSIHVTAETAKLVVRNHTGRFPERSYFSGCNTGGHQALMEAQRYPGDYDGIVAGAPAADRVHEIEGYLWAWMATHHEGVSLLSQAKLQTVTSAAVAACDALDGVSDGVLDDPRRCTFDPATLACRGAETDRCLTPPQLEAMKRVYEGPRHPRTGDRIFPGWPLGSEGFGASAGQGWGNFINIP